ncbi:MAG: MBL fold metallo-hydrolase [Cyanobacteria bacterium P01_H01_bin.121]
MSGQSERSVQPSEAPQNNTMAEQGHFFARFWGVRGSIPTPDAEFIGFGGNTACVELRVADQRLIFDGGTGLRALGQTLIAQAPIEAHLFFTNAHWDRIQGFPFFKPAFVATNSFHIYGAMALNGASIKQLLMSQMIRPNFPVSLKAMQANLQFYNVVPGEIIQLTPELEIETCTLNPSNRAIGYRVNWHGHSIVYATDAADATEHVDATLMYLARDADLLIYDVAQLETLPYDTDSLDDCQMKIWEAGLQMAKQANVKQVALFHHEPGCSDRCLAAYEKQLKTQFAQCQFAREGMTIAVA